MEDKEQKEEKLRPDELIPFGGLSYKGRKRGPKESKYCPDTLARLEFAFSIGCPISEACVHADISEHTYQDWIAKYPELVARFKRFQEGHFLKARYAVTQAMLSDGKLALQYLERKKKAEFSLRTELTGADGAPLNVQIVDFTKLPDANSNPAV
jgi:hypothetical protein